MIQPRGLGADESGDTLVEVLAAITVLGIGVTGLMTSLGVMATTTSSNRSQTREYQSLASAAEYVKGMTLTGAAAPATLCAASTPTTITAITLPTGFTATYGPATAAVSGIACTTLMSIPVQVTGDGYNQTVTVVRRP